MNEAKRTDRTWDSILVKGEGFSLLDTQAMTGTRAANIRILASKLAAEGFDHAAVSHTLSSLGSRYSGHIFVQTHSKSVVIHSATTSVNKTAKLIVSL